MDNQFLIERIEAALCGVTKKPGIYVSPGLLQDCVRALKSPLPEGWDTEDAARYRWLRADGERARKADIVADFKGDMLDHHIDKGRCGL